MRTPKLEWKKCGHSYYAHVGRLTLSVKRRPRTLYGAGPWFVGEVFGNHFPISGSPDFKTFEEAAIAAETAARTLLQNALKALGRGRC